MKKIISILLALVMVFGTGAVAFAENQTSVPEGYIGIYTAEDLNNIRNNLSGKYILMNDIDLSVYENWEPIGDTDNPFTGELNGNGYYIKSLTIKKTLSKGENNIGLFGVAEDCLIEKVIIVNSQISVSVPQDNVYPSPNVTVGTIVAKMRSENSSRIRNCLAVGKTEVSGGYVVCVGGLVGEAVNYNVIFLSTNYVDIYIKAEKQEQKICVGGMLGKISADNNDFSETRFSILRAANFGEISINNSEGCEETRIFAGGICGHQISGNEFSECYNRGEILTASSVGAIAVGGIVGEAIWRVENCYNAGEIKAVTDENDTENSICFIKLPSAFIGNAPIFPDDFTVYNCYSLTSDIPICSQELGRDYNFYTKTGYLSKEELRLSSSFDGFDFEKIWAMEENGYPVLKNQPTVTIKENIELVEGDVYGDKVIANEWVSTNSDVATVNENGEIVAVGAGEATITVKIAYGYTEEITVNVIGEVEVPEPQKSLFEKIFDFIKGLLERIVDFILRIFSLEKLI